jgi:pimeloyl-ACP methyl ester carboxylesterase
LLSALAALAAVAGLGLPLSLFLLQDRLVFFPQPLPEARRAEIAQRFPNVMEVVVESGGHKLHAFHVPGRPGAPLVLYFGGNAEEVSWIIGDAAARTPGVGWLLTSYRGYGRSEGAPSEASISADALRWHDYAAKELGSKNVFAFGRSLGSGAAVFLASQRSLAGVILVTPFDSLVEVAKRHYPFLPVGWMLRHRFDSAALAPAIRAPLLCLAAMRDEVIPASHARTLYDAWGGPRRWIELHGAGHNSTDGAPAFWENIRAFLEESAIRP